MNIFLCKVLIPGLIFLSCFALESYTVRYTSSEKEYKEFISALQKQKVRYEVFRFQDGIYEIHYKEPKDTVIK